MNRYGAMARDHWRTWLPTRYAQISDPETYFQNLGQRVADQVAELSTTMSEDDPPGETYMDKVGRLTATRQRAEEIVLAEEVLLAPEPGADPDGIEEPEETSGPATDSGWIPTIEDPTHPYWRQVQEQEHRGR